MYTFSTEEIAGEAEDNITGSSIHGSSIHGNNPHHCPYCSTNYARHPVSPCAHLLCETYYAESNEEFVVAPNSSITANVCGVDVPRVVAMRFMRHLRETPSQCSSVTDQLCTIKYSVEHGHSFQEWTYFLTHTPARKAALLEGFARKVYKDSSIPSSVLKFSDIYMHGGVAAVSAESLHRDLSGFTPHSSLSEAPMQWLMMTGLPDRMPLFLFPFLQAQEGDKPIYAVRSEPVLARIQEWTAVPETCTVHHVVTLPSYLIS